MTIVNGRYVRLNVPELGLGNIMDEMVLFCLERSERLRAGCLRVGSDQRDWLVFHFRDPKNAEDFAERFRGELFEPGSDRLSLH
jgi:hypothetical protein